MVFSQRLVSHYWPTWEFNHGEVFCCIHGIQVCTDYRNLREVLIWMALFFIDGTRQDLLRFSVSFRFFSTGPFGWGGVGAGAVVGFCGPGGG